MPRTSAFQNVSPAHRLRVGLVARTDDLIAHALARVAASRGHHTTWIPFIDMLDGRSARMNDDGSWHLGDHRIDDCDAYIVRSHPSPTAMTDRADTLRTAEQHWQRQLLQKERAGFALSFLYAMEDAGRCMINPQRRAAPYDHKPAQLAAFRSAGLPLPATCITNDPAHALAFAARIGATIIKPLAGGAHTVLLDDDARARLDAIRAAPAIFQQLIDGDNVRATIVDGRVVSAVVIPSATLDYREDVDYQAGRTEYQPTKLSAIERRICVAAARVSHHVLSGVDFRRGKHGPVLLEANSSPVYLDIEQKTGHEITAAIIDACERRRATS